MLTFSFLIGILIMNLFVAILCRSYTEASEVAHEVFMRYRANTVIDHKAMSEGLRILRCKRRRTLACSDSLRASSLQTDEVMESFIWYCRPRDAA
mmetsp:Transcript_27793/g.86509  ORF Transcript_27793/g.86509 Transcript_27793/m.86509 type:complete len:95 (+) Transcript_27793:1690-1974(+)